MVTEKKMKTGSPELYSHFPKGFLPIAETLTGVGRFTVRAIAIGDRYDDTGLIDVLEEISNDYRVFKEKMESALKAYGNEHNDK